MGRQVLRTKLQSWMSLWLVLACSIAGLSIESFAAEPQPEVQAIDDAVYAAVKYLAGKQARDGAWRSDVYAPFKEGDALSPLVLTALLPLPMDATTWGASELGLRYLAELSKTAFAMPRDAVPLAYPTYSAAQVTIALHQWRRQEDEAVRAKWLQLLRDLQLTEATGWTPEDVEYGGWTYGQTAAKKPAADQPLGTLDQPNLSATAFALVALQIAGVVPSDPAIQKGLHFVERLQNDDGGFFFIHGDKVRNKAGVDGTGVGDYRSYGSATADGLRSLVACGEGKKGLAQDARTWLESQFSPTSHPGKYPPDRAGAQNALYFYYSAALAQVFRELDVRELPKESTNRDWSQALAAVLIKRQSPKGSWSNAAVDQREDDPIIATSFAIQALTACRGRQVLDVRPAIRQAADGSLTCHARDATCHGKTLRFEPQPRKNTLGYWTDEADYPSWQVAIDRPGEFEVVILQGCGPGLGKSQLVLEVAAEKLTFLAQETGHFQNFQFRPLGKIKILTPGLHELAIKPLQKAGSAIMDVRQIRLVPAEKK